MRREMICESADAVTISVGISQNSSWQAHANMSASICEGKDFVTSWLGGRDHGEVTGRLFRAARKRVAHLNSCVITLKTECWTWAENDSGFGRV